MEQTEKDVKTIIIKVSKLPGSAEGLEDGTTLGELNYNDPMCRSLESKLNQYVKEQGADERIDDGDLDPDKTAGEVVEIVEDKLQVP
ncbi:hypothetical protein [Mucilaginibacter kameinonensis]|uniref:hypothetical protein n=1 Tax=Mucilaginibacter kameinonensis TaxID=452286 RepID=UPI000EF84245|nr:hypothetical protein [Mucilaginibacter kameinonensis]